MQIESIEGIVLKKTLYQDHKMIVNFFTENHGLITLSIPISKKKISHLGMFEVGNVVILDVDKEKHPFKFKEAFVQYCPHTIRSKLSLLKAFLKLLTHLNQILEPELAVPPFYKLVKNSLKAFETVSCPESLTLFIIIKWMQFEGILPLSQNPLINLELTKLLSIKSFDTLQPIHEELKTFMTQVLKQDPFTRCLH